ncbi:MAG: MBL fold metallo-hydrolase [Anaerolineae bacterium]|jgi:phosphoribosyl 1,2-cyclic phosphate phosphodiesterase
MKGDELQLIFLGCSDAQGVPRIGCECDVCRNVLSSGSRNQRTGPSVALCYGPSYAERTVLIDAAPELRLQATKLGLHRFDALLLTHAHDAHILGLGVLLNSPFDAGRVLPVYAPSHVLDDARERFSYWWKDKAYRRVVHPEPIEEGAELWGLEVRPVRVDHGIGGTAYGYLINIGAHRLAYIPDILRATTEVRQALVELDLLVLGTSHYYDSTERWKRSSMDIMTALELIRDLRPKRAILTHLSHTVDYEEISTRLPRGVSLAYDGYLVEIEE